MMGIGSARGWAIFLLLLASLAPGSVSGQEQAPAPMAHPAIWKVGDGTNTLYLFGSLHILPESVDWTTPEIESAMQNSDTFVFEVPVDDQAFLDEREFILENGILPSRTTLRSILSRREYLIYSTILIRAGLKPEVFEHYRPWLASLVLGLAYLHPDNIASLGGADDALVEYAEANGKKVQYLETVEDQLRLLSSPSDVSQTQSLKRLIRTLPRSRVQSEELLNMWTAGDVDRLGAVILGSFRGYSEMEDRLIGHRNRVWLARIKDFLESGAGTALVTVGAAHIAGQSGLISLLCAQGYEVDRLGPGGSRVCGPGA